MQSVTVAVMLPADVYQRDPARMEAGMWYRLWDEYIVPILQHNAGNPDGVWLRPYKPRMWADPMAIGPGAHIGDQYVMKLTIQAPTFPPGIQHKLDQRAAQLAADMEDDRKW